MMRLNNNILQMFFFLFSFDFIIAQNCGTERWDVKTLSDIDTSFINFEVIRNSSVHEQVNLTAPFGRLYSRLASETAVYSLDCMIIGYSRQADRDIHIVIKDLNTEETMVIEILSPKCPEIQNTSKYDSVKKLYTWFSKNIGVPKHTFTTLKESRKVSITGIGFWDYLHGQTGMANNAREIHPVLSMKLK